MAPSPKSHALRKIAVESSQWARDPLDFYIEPEWVSERLFAVERFAGSILDPACGIGRIVVSARAAGYVAHGQDIAARDPGAFHQMDFFNRRAVGEPNIVSNPPFGIAEEFVAHALKLAERKVAMLLPANWVLGDKRSRWLETTPLARVLFITPRPSIPPGPVLIAMAKDGNEPSNGTTDYAWFIWERGHKGAAQIGWLRRDGAAP